jgi:type I restriction enzyme R subunit
VIPRLIELGKEMGEAHKGGENLDLTDELTSLEMTDGAVNLLGDETLQTIVRELLDAIRKNVTTDWTVKESARALYEARYRPNW